MVIAGVDAGPVAHCPVMELAEEVATTDLSCAFVSTPGTAAMVSGIGVFDRYDCRLIRVAP